MKIDLTNDEYLLLRGCLAIGHFVAKDEGNEDEMEEINKLEHKLIEANMRWRNFLNE